MPVWLSWLKVCEYDLWVCLVGCKNYPNLLSVIFLHFWSLAERSARPGRLMTLMSWLSNQGSQLMPDTGQTPNYLQPQFEWVLTICCWWWWWHWPRVTSLSVIITLHYAFWYCGVSRSCWPINMELKFSSHSCHQFWDAWIKVTREGPPPPHSNNGQIPAILLLLFWINVRCEIFERFGQFMTVVTGRYWRFIYRGLTAWHQPILNSPVQLDISQLQSNSSQPAIPGNSSFSGWSVIVSGPGGHWGLSILSVIMSPFVSTRQD